ncbi:MAG: chemotaxis protein CheA [Desulfobacterales bacterium]|nr:chemotaxis protein CheA [Desulfobacterales bacterium]MDD4071381.1 chemotaxis protein CheA [Desulfobacterales bacterium]MDD4391426.1 chemotaxis protein CheA [Desulfobacterales bacterium]
MNDTDETLQIFFAEAEDLFKIAEESLLRLEDSPGPGPDVEELFRALHTLKSGSAMVGFETVSECAHLIENLLDRIRNNELTISKPLISFLLKGVDLIREMVDRSAEGRPAASPETITDFKNQLSRFPGNDAIPDPETSPPQETGPAPYAAPSKKNLPAKSAAPAPTADRPSDSCRYYRINLQFKRNFFDCGQDPLILLRNLGDLGDTIEIVADISQIPRYDDLIPCELYIIWKLVLKTTAPQSELEDIFIFVRSENRIDIDDITNHYQNDVDLQAANLTIGEALVEKEGISRQDIKQALRKQKKIGEILIEDGKIDEKTLDKIVALQEKSRSAYRKTSIRIDVNKINYLVNLAEEIGIGLSKLEKLLYEPGHVNLNDIEQELENLTKVNQEFQQRVTNVRMFPLEGTFTRYLRLARDTACEQNKQIKVVLSGVDTELDKEIIEYITDPLKHIVRNCVDHGIEPPEERIAAGKPPEGRLDFRAYQRSGKIYVEISDDGRGLNVEKIRQRAIEQGLITAKQPLDNDALLECICRPGFSTASSVTPMSGRGVGLDVVKTQVERLGGILRVNTQPAKGTTFTLALPLTYALTHSLHLICRERSFLIPIWGVVATERFNPARIKTFGADETLYKFRENYIPLMDIPQFFDLTRKNTPLSGNILVFIDTGKKQFALIVDDVLDPHQVVVKTLETNYRSVQGVSGATILSDGSVALVLDLLGLEEMFFKQPSYSGSET